MLIPLRAIACQPVKVNWKACLAVQGFYATPAIRHGERIDESDPPIDGSHSVDRVQERWPKVVSWTDSINGDPE